MSNKILSGNILTDFSDHYAQFVPVVIKGTTQFFLKITLGMFQYKILIITSKMLMINLIISISSWKAVLKDMPLHST